MPRPLLARLALSGLSGCLALAAACAAQVSAPPPRSPLADLPAFGTGRASTNPIAPPPSLPAGASPPLGTGAPPASGLEAAAGRAAALLAEWLAVPERGLSVVAVEAVAWPDACLGVAQPGVVCVPSGTVPGGAVVTPGFKVLLRDPAGGTHAVHADATGSRARWAGEVTVRGTIETVDPTSRRLTITVNGKPLLLRFAPGSSMPRSPAVGARVVLAYDPAPASGDGPAPLAWLVPDPS